MKPILTTRPHGMLPLEREIPPYTYTLSSRYDYVSTLECMKPGYMFFAEPLTLGRTPGSLSAAIRGAIRQRQKHERERTQYLVYLGNKGTTRGVYCWRLK